MAPIHQDTYTCVQSYSRSLYRKLIMEAAKIASAYPQLDQESRKDLTKRIEQSLMNLAAFFAPMARGDL